MEYTLIFPLIMLVVCIIAFCFITYFIDICHKNKAVERQLNIGDKVWCYYTVKDSKTQKLLICGNKFRSFNDLVCIGCISRNLGMRKVFVYETTQEICGVECIITFYANAPYRKGDYPCFIVEPDGESLFKFNDEAA